MAKRVNASTTHDTQKQTIVAVLLIGIILFVVLVAPKVLSNKNTKNDEEQTATPEASAGAGLQATQEAKLKNIYETEKNVSLKNVMPRYSVFENLDLGFRFSYPVSFDINPQDSFVEIIPNTGPGRLKLTVKNGTFDVAVETSGADAKQIEVLQKTKEFVGGSFKFVTARTYSSQELKDRFSQGNENVDRY